MFSQRACLPVLCQSLHFCFHAYLLPVLFGQSLIQCALRSVLCSLVSVVRFCAPTVHLVFLSFLAPESPGMRVLKHRSSLVPCRVLICDFSSVPLVSLFPVCLAPDHFHVYLVNCEVCQQINQSFKFIFSFLSPAWGPFCLPVKAKM